MMANYSNRIKNDVKEMVQLKNDELQSCPIRVEVVNNTLTTLIGEIAGPPDSAYEGGTFSLEINVPRDYPFRPPKIRFLTRIWHPNIPHLSGVVCLDDWAPGITIRTLLQSLQVLLAKPEIDNAQDFNVARQYKESQSMFHDTAQYWTAMYAKGPHKNAEFESHFQHLVQLGVEEAIAVETLSIYNWDMKRAEALALHFD